MATSLRGLLARLECDPRRCGRGRCGACGRSDAEPVTFEVPMPRLIGEPPDPDDDPAMDACRACGRRLVFRLAPPRVIGNPAEDRSAA